MNKVLWQKIDDFAPYEFGCDDMDGILIYTLQQMRKYVNRKIIIHCGYENRKSGWHPEKRAVDCHIEGLHVIDQFLVASRFDNFNGLGVYPAWKRPGLHLDTRPKNKIFDNDARWGCIKAGKYIPLSKEFFKQII